MESVGQARRKRTLQGGKLVRGSAQVKPVLPVLRSVLDRFAQTGFQYFRRIVEGNDQLIARTVLLGGIRGVSGVHAVPQHFVPILGPEDFLHLVDAVAHCGESADEASDAGAADEVDGNILLEEVAQGADLSRTLGAASGESQSYHWTVLPGAYTVEVGAYLLDYYGVGLGIDAVGRQAVGIFLGVERKAREEK